MYQLDVYSFYCRNFQTVRFPADADLSSTCRRNRAKYTYGWPISRPVSVFAIYVLGHLCRHKIKKKSSFPSAQGHFSFSLAQTPTESQTTSNTTTVNETEHTYIIISFSFHTHGIL